MALKRLVTEFYRLHNPDKCTTKHIGRVVQSYLGREAALWEDLGRKYPHATVPPVLPSEDDADASDSSGSGAGAGGVSPSPAPTSSSGGADSSADDVGAGVAGSEGDTAGGASAPVDAVDVYAAP